MIIRVIATRILVILAYNPKPNTQHKHYKGWNNKSGKKRLNSIKIPAVIVIQTAAKTGAVDKNLTKCGMDYLRDTKSIKWRDRCDRQQYIWSKNGTGCVNQAG
jgi:hypothetical protein